MVNYLFIFILIFCVQSLGSIKVGISSFSWQERLPISYIEESTGLNKTENRLATFSTNGIGIGYEKLLFTRWRATSSILYQSGTVDFHRIENFTSPRKTTQTLFWLIGIDFRVTKKYTIGPHLLLNYNKISDTGVGSAYNPMLGMEFDIFENTRVYQSFGSTSTSQKLIYNLGINQIF